MRFNPGPGLGGHCIPFDPFYLAWRAREAGVPTRFIELAGEINTSMPGYVIEKLQAALNERGKAVKGAKVLVLGLAYKPNIDDPRESPAFEIIDRLLEARRRGQLPRSPHPGRPQHAQLARPAANGVAAPKLRNPGYCRRYPSHHQPRSGRLRPRSRTCAAHH